MMTRNDLKTELHRLIDQVQDSHLLQAVHIILAREVAHDQEVNWSELSPEAKQAIEEGSADIEKGHVSSHKDVMDRVKSKFKL
jgi:predicted transcriptional regulator